MIIRIAFIALIIFISYKIAAALIEAKEDWDYEKANKRRQEEYARQQAEQDSIVRQKLTAAREYRTGNVINLTRQLDEFLEKTRSSAEYTDFVKMALSEGNYFAKYWLMAHDNLRNSIDFMQAASDARRYKDLISGQDWADMMADILLLGEDTQEETDWQKREMPQYLRNVYDAVGGKNYHDICPLLYKSHTADGQMLLHLLLPRISLYTGSAEEIWGLSRGEYINATVSYWADRQLGEPQYLFKNDYQELSANSWHGHNAPLYKDRVSAGDLYRFRSSAVFRHYAVCSAPEGDGGFRLLKELIDNDAEAAILFRHENAVTNTWFHVLLADWLNLGDPISPIVLQDQILRHNAIIAEYGQKPDGVLALHALGTSDRLPYLNKISSSQLPDLFALYLLANNTLAASGGFYRNNMDLICKTVAQAGGIDQKTVNNYRRQADLYALRLKDSHGIKIDDWYVLPRTIYSMDGKPWEFQTYGSYYERKGGKKREYDIYRMNFPEKTIEDLDDGYIRVSGIQDSDYLTDPHYDVSFRTYRNVEFRW